MGHLVPLHRMKDEKLSRVWVNTAGVNVFAMSVDANKDIGSQEHHLVYQQSGYPSHLFKEQRKRNAVFKRLAHQAYIREAREGIQPIPFLGDYPALRTPDTNEFLGIKDDLVARLLKVKDGLDHSIITEEDIGNIIWDRNYGYNLRPYQIRGIHNAFKRLASPRDVNKGIMVYAPTAAGKNAIGISTLLAAIEKRPDAKIVVLTEDSTVFRQWQDVFMGAGLNNFNMFGDGANIINRSNITIAMCQTIRRMFECFDPFVLGTPHLVIIDEAHVLHYQSYLGHWLNHGADVIGLSATPRTSSKLRYFFDERIEEVTTTDYLREAGHVVPYEIRMPVAAKTMLETTEADDKKPTRQLLGGMSTSEYCNKTSENIQGIIEEWEQERGEPFYGMVVCTQKDKTEGDDTDCLRHVDQMVRAINDFKGIGYAKAFTEKEGRRREFDDIISNNNPTTKIACVVHRFCKGYDHHRFAHIIIARRSMKMSTLRQIIGRVERAPKDGVLKESTITDFGFNVPYFIKLAKKNKFGDIYEMLESPPRKLLPFPGDDQYNDWEDEDNELDGKKSSSSDHRQPTDIEIGTSTITIARSFSYRGYKTSEILGYVAVELESQGKEPRTDRFAADASAMFGAITGETIGDDRDSLRMLFKDNPKAERIWERKHKMPLALQDAIESSDTQGNKT